MTGECCGWSGTGLPAWPRGRGDPRLLVARGDAEDGDDLGLMRLGVGDVGAGAAAEPAGGFVVADEDAGMALAVAVLDPDLVPLAEPVLDRVVAHRPQSICRDKGRGSRRLLPGFSFTKTRLGKSIGSITDPKNLGGSIRDGGFK